MSPVLDNSALVVEPDAADRAFLVSALRSAGLSVIAVESFLDAMTVIVARPPCVLVTEIRLGDHNGGHLALVGRLMKSDMILLLASRPRHRVLARDAELLGAAFIEKPMTEAGVVSSLYQGGLAPRRRPTAGASSKSQRRTRRDIASFLLHWASGRHVE